ncbi:MAG: sensor histidine kinase, partial [Cypionkella sp.]
TAPAGTVTDSREGAGAVFGYPPAEIVGASCDILFTPEDRAAGEPERERATAAAEGRAPDVRWHMRKDGSRVFIDGVSTALRGADGKLVGFLKIGQDVTERHAAEERQKLLLAELQHRVRNTLGMIRSMVRFTAEGHDDIEDYLSHLTGRLDSLSRIQQLLTRSPNAQVDLHELVSGEMTAQAGGRSAYRLDGPPVALAPKAAEVLSLALHELVTNSVKYGALGELGQTGAQVGVEWNVIPRGEQQWLELRWREPLRSAARGAPRRGFGTELITERVPYELRGEARLEIGKGQVIAEIAFPLASGPMSLLETRAPQRGAS